MYNYPPVFSREHIKPFLKAFLYMNPNEDFKSIAELLNVSSREIKHAVNYSVTKNVKESVVQYFFTIKSIPDKKHLAIVEKEKDTNYCLAVEMSKCKSYFEAMTLRRKYYTKFIHIPSKRKMIYENMS